MKMADFKALTQAEQLTRLNTHLLMLKQLEGRLEDNFKRDEFDFSYSLLKKNAADLGIVVDGKRYVAYATGEEPPIKTNVISRTLNDVVISKQNNVKQDVVKQTSNDIVKAQQELTNEEIAFIKDLYVKLQVNNNEQQFIVNGKPMLVVPAMVGVKKTTGISVYVEQWERWSMFKQKYNMYSGTDLLAMALQEFMDKYDVED